MLRNLSLHLEWVEFSFLFLLRGCLGDGQRVYEFSCDYCWQYRSIIYVSRPTCEFILQKPQIRRGQCACYVRGVRSKSPEPSGISPRHLCHGLATSRGITSSARPSTPPMIHIPIALFKQKNTCACLCHENLFSQRNKLRHRRRTDMSVTILDGRKLWIVYTRNDIREYYTKEEGCVTLFYRLCKSVWLSTSPKTVGIAR